MSQVKLPLLTSAMLVVTHRCCMACRYCFVQQENCDMTYETAVKAAHFLIENGKAAKNTPNITFFGGEPLLMWDDIIKPLVLYVRNELQTPFSFSITTNGALITDEILDFLKEYRVSIHLSIDGDKETQDYNRPLYSGESSFDVLYPKMRAIITRFPTTVFRSTITQPTCGLTWNNIKFAIDNDFKTFYTVPNVFEKWSEENKALLKVQIREYSDYYINSYRMGKIPIRFTSLEEAMKRIIHINTAAKTGEYRVRDYCLACGKCGLGSTKSCAISPDGNLYACQEMTSNEEPDSIFYIGNLDTGVDEVRRWSLINSYDPIKNMGPNCKTCYYNRVCDGGCVANNYMTNGDIHVNPDMFCWWRQLLLSESEYIINILGSEKNSLFKEYWVRINYERI